MPEVLGVPCTGYEGAVIRLLSSLASEGAQFLNVTVVPHLSDVPMCVFGLC